MQEYHKIETIYARDMDGSKKLIAGKYRDPAVEYISQCLWDWTEKVDGTNIRVHWDGHNVEFGGRTDKAQIPADLVNRLNTLFGGDENEQIFEQLFGDKDVILFGEGYGAKIQNGGDYTDGNGVDFVLFDVMVNGMYLVRQDVESIAEAFLTSVVPIVGSGTLDAAVDFVKSHPMSRIGNGKHEMEGVVCRPAIEMRDRRGNRIIVKIKYRDLQQTV